MKKDENAPPFNVDRQPLATDEEGKIESIWSTPSIDFEQRPISIWLSTASLSVSLSFFTFLAVFLIRSLDSFLVERQRQWMTFFVARCLARPWCVVPLCCPCFGVTLF